MSDKPKTSQRLASLDWMRGFVMVLMVIDHASMAYNVRHLSYDSASSYITGAVYSASEFLTRWASHLCAPTFVFLAGTALAISIDRKVARGADQSVISRDMVIRGLIIAALDPTLISLLKGQLTFQVLFAIGMGMVLMAWLRRLPVIWLTGLALLWLVVGEALTGVVWDPPAWADPLSALLIAVHVGPDMVVKYPVIPWTAMMMLGWAFGIYLTRYLAGDRGGWSPVRLLTVSGIICLLIFMLVRGVNDYGNMFMLRESNHWMHWLYVSKYPPSLSFTALELGLLALCLAGFMVLERRVPVKQNGPLLLFGQTALFFYIVHRIIFDSSARLFDLHASMSLADVYLVSLAMLVFLYPLCLWYRRYKSAHRDSWVRFI
jgi:uncharacterized membrane protein